MAPLTPQTTALFPTAVSDPLETHCWQDATCFPHLHLSGLPIFQPTHKHKEYCDRDQLHPDRGVNVPLAHPWGRKRLLRGGETKRQAQCRMHGVSQSEKSESSSCSCRCKTSFFTSCCTPRSIISCLLSSSPCWQMGPTSFKIRAASACTSPRHQNSFQSGEQNTTTEEKHSMCHCTGTV